MHHIHKTIALCLALGAATSCNTETVTLDVKKKKDNTKAQEVTHDTATIVFEDSSGPPITSSAPVAHRDVATLQRTVDEKEIALKAVIKAGTTQKRNEVLPRVLEHAARTEDVNALQTLSSAGNAVEKKEEQPPRPAYAEAALEPIEEKVYIHAKEDNGWMPLHCSNSYGQSLTLTVSSTDELNSAIIKANSTQSSSDQSSIEINSNITLSADILPINTKGTLYIESSMNTAAKIDGANKYKGFTVLNGIVSLTSLNIQNMVSQGLPGCMGAGGGLFVANTTGYPSATQYAPNVTLTKVNFTGCSAYGGNNVDSSSAGKGGNGGGGGGFGWSGGERGDDGAQGGTGSIPNGNNLFGNKLESGCFGIVGTPGSGGAGGSGGDGGGGGGIGGGGHSGSNGGNGGQGGYGAGGGGGGGGGGAGGGGGGGSFDIGFVSYEDGGNGGNGPNGGIIGPYGFGGQSRNLPGNSPGTPGQGHGKPNGGNGGRGGNGALAGNGAGFGGAIFAMDNASILFKSPGTMSANHACAGMYTGGGGPDIFLQGAGKLNFYIEEGDTYTISDGIADEAGAVSHGLASTVASPTGPDGLPTGGGNGVWSINKEGYGKLHIKNKFLLSGNVTISQGEIDLSKCTKSNNPRMLFRENTKFTYRPNITSDLKIDVLSIPENVTLFLNGHSSILARKIICPSGKLKIDLEPTGFTSDVPVQAIKSVEPIDKKLEVTVSNGHECKIHDNSIMIRKNVKTYQPADNTKSTK